MTRKKPVTRGVLCSFSGPAALLPPSRRTPENVLAALRMNPRVSTWDMSETAWLRGCIEALKNNGRIIEDKDEPYPWHRYYISKPKKENGGKPTRRARQRRDKREPWPEREDQ